MPTEPARYRPRSYPPPEFPPRRTPLFARTPLAIFPAILGLAGLVLALRIGLVRLNLDTAVADLLAGLVVPLWAFAVLAYGTKILRRPGVVAEDLRVIPSRSGMGAMTVGGMDVAALLAPHAPGAGTVLLAVALVAQVAVAVAVGRAILAGPPETRHVNAGWHLVFSGFIVGAMAAMRLDLPLLAQVLFWATLPVAAAIWIVGAVDYLRNPPPAPLRPMLAIHLAPAAFFCAVAQGTGYPLMATGFALFSVAILAFLLFAGRWITAAGFSPLWAAFTFPLTACAGALMQMPGLFGPLGTGLTAVALAIVPVIAWNVLRLWPGGRLAARTNAATA